MLKSSLVFSLCAGLLPCYAAEFMTGQAARAVIGQTTFVSQNTGNTEASFGGPGGLAFAGNTLFVTDANRLGLGINYNRVLMFGNILTDLPGPLQEIPPATARCPLCGGGATTVLGDKNSDSVPIAATTQSGMNLPTAVASDGTVVAVADTANNRVLLWASTPNTFGQKSDVVLGQADFTTAAAQPISASSLRGPQGVWIQNGKLYVADTGDNRILIWNSIPTRNNQAADLVLGEPDFTSTTPQQIINLALPTTASNLLSPTSVTSDGTRLYVADLGFNRVLIWNSLPTRTQQPADVEVGQKDMTTSLANDSADLCASNGADANNNPTYPVRCEKTLNFPRFALSDGRRLYIADAGNDRVLVYNQIPMLSAAAADAVLGEPDFASDVITNPTGFNFSANPTTVSASNVTPTPTSLAWDGMNLYVADATNYRVLIFTPGEGNVALDGVVNFASRNIFALGSITIGGTIVPGNLVTVTITPGSGGITVTAGGITLTGGSSTNKASGTVTLSGTTFTTGNVATMSIGGTKYIYTAISGDTLTTIATKLAAVVNAGAGDPNVTVSASGAVITVTARNTGDAGNNITLGGNIYTYTVLAGDTLDTVSKALANVINSSNGGLGDPNLTAVYEPNQNLILLVARAPGEAGNSVSISTGSATGTVTMTVTASGSTLLGGSGANKAFATVVIGGTTVTAGNVASVTISSVNYSFTAKGGDTVNTVAAGLANAINASNSGAGDPNVTVAVSGAAITLTARAAGDAGNGLTLSAAASAAGSTTATASGNTLTGGANAGNLAPGAFITIRGTNLADATAKADQTAQQLPWTLAGVEVYVDGNRAPLFDASPTSIDAQMPWEVVNSTNVSIYVRTLHNNGSVTISNAIGSGINPGSPGLYAADGAEPRAAMAYHASSFATARVAVTGRIQSGDVPKITIGDRSYTYTVTAGTKVILTARNTGAAGNGITLGAGISSGGTITATASGSTLTGGADGVSASGNVAIAGTTITGGNIATVTINGSSYTYSVASSDDLNAIARGVVNAINTSNAGAGDPNVTASVDGDSLQTIALGLAAAINGSTEEILTAAPLTVGTGLLLTAKTPGPEGNGITVTASSSTGTTGTAGAVVSLSVTNTVTCCANIANAPVTQANPAVAGETIYLYGTGLGLVCTPANVKPGDCTPPDPAKDALNTGSQYLGPAANVASNSVTANVSGGTTTTITSGIVPGTFGLYRITVELPSGLTANPFTRIYLQQSFTTSNIATIPIGPPAQ